VTFGLYYDFRLHRPRAGRRPRFEAAVAILRRALGGGGRGRRSCRAPPVRPGGPELWIGALARPAVERAAWLADGILSVLPDQSASTSTPAAPAGATMDK